MNRPERDALKPAEKASERTYREAKARGRFMSLSIELFRQAGFRLGILTQAEMYSHW